MRDQLATFTAVLRNNTRFSDAEICVGDATFQIHRSVICGVSEFFNTAFSDDFQEAEKRLLKIEQASLAAMSVVIDFAYCMDVEKELSEMGFEHAWELISLSDRFQVRKLTRVAAAVACAKVSNDNCIQLYKLLGELNCDQKHTVRTYIVRRMYNVSTRADFPSVPVDDMESFISSREEIITERQLCLVIREWLKSNDANEMVAARLFDHVFFELLKQMKIASILRPKQCCRLRLAELSQLEEVHPDLENGMQIYCSRSYMQAISGTPTGIMSKFMA